MAYLNEDGVQRLINLIKLYQVAKPVSSPNGSQGQILTSNGDGTTTWSNVGLPTDAQTAIAVNAWLDAHPDATTSVEDGSISIAKLNTALAAIVNAAAATTESYDSLELALHKMGLVVYNNQFYVNPDRNT